MKDLHQITVVGLGLLGGSITLTAKSSFPDMHTVGYTHRAATRDKARSAAIADKVFDDLGQSVEKADLVILASPIGTFEKILSEMAPALPEGCIVTDVGSTKTIVHKWAADILPEHVRYTGSHPIAGSEQRGLEFARDDLFERAACIITKDKNSDSQAVKTLRDFWEKLGCIVELMSPAKHDRIFADISHLPHAVAAALINANDSKTLRSAGQGFIDTSRIASGPANIWADVFLTNTGNLVDGIERVAQQLKELRRILKKQDRDELEKLLNRARDKRARMIKYKMQKKELI